MKVSPHPKSLRVWPGSAFRRAANGTITTFDAPNSAATYFMTINSFGGIGGAYDPSRRMPAILRYLLGRRPVVWINLMDGRLSGQSTTR
jgi:hypothetical protein